MRNFITIIIIIISVTAGALFIKSMLELEKEASDYLDSRQNSTAKKSTEKEITDTESDKSKLNPDHDIVAENTNRPSDETLGKQAFIKKMFDDPNMSENLRNQPKLVLNELYDDLYIDLGLNEEDIDKFTDLIIEINASDSDNEEPNTRNIDDEIKELIGDLYYEDYNQYNKTLDKRIKVIQYKNQLASSNIALMPQQQDSLLNLMLEKCELECDENILDKSGQFLDTEQIEVLEKFQNTISNTDEISIESLPEY